MSNLSTRTLKHNPWLWTVPALLLGAAILITGLTNTGLWADEGWTIAATSESTPLHVVTDWVISDVHPPLYFIILNLWRMFTGDTILEMRYFSVLVSMLGIAVAYRCGKALFNQRAGVYAALFMAMHDLVRALTQEVRHYPGQILLTTLTIWMYWLFWQKGGRGRMIGFVLAGAALIYTHYWGGFVLIGLGIHTLITRRDQLRRMLLGFVGIGLLYLPWLPVLYNQITLERPSGLSHALENSRTVYAVLTFQLIGIPEWFWVILAVVGLMTAFNGNPLRWKPSAVGLALLLIALIAPTMSILINTVYPSLSFRALAVVIPPVILLAANGLASFRQREQMIVLAFILVYGLTTTSAGPIDRAPWQAVADEMALASDDSDVILLELDTDEYAVAYYLSQYDPAVDFAHSETTRALHPDDYPAFMQETLADKNGIWVAKLGWPGLEDEYDIRPELQAQGWKLTTPELDHYGIYIYRPILLWRLDRPPAADAEPLATYGDELRMMRAEATHHPAGITLNMLWTPETAPSQEYTISVILFDEDGNVVTNADSRPLAGRSLTSTWEPGGLYFDTHALTGDFATGTYRVAVQVYYFADGDVSRLEHVTADTCQDDPDCHYVIVDEVVVGE